MGGIFHAIETTQPRLEGKTTDQKVDEILNYLFMLREQLDYALCNLDSGNFNETGLKEINAPIYGRIEGVEGEVTEIKITEAGLATRVTNAEGDISSLEQTATSLTTRVGTAEGNISTLQQTSSSIQAAVTDGQGNYTVMNLKSDGIYIGGGSSATRLNGSYVDVTQNSDFNSTASTASGAASTASSALSTANGAASTASTALTTAQQIANGTYQGGTFINEDTIFSPNIYGNDVTIHVGKDYATTRDPGAFEIVSQINSNTSIFRIESTATVPPLAKVTSDTAVEIRANTYFYSIANFENEVSLGGDIILTRGVNYGTASERPATGTTGQLFFVLQS